MIAAGALVSAIAAATNAASTLELLAGPGGELRETVINLAVVRHDDWVIFGVTQGDFSPVPDITHLAATASRPDRQVIEEMLAITGAISHTDDGKAAWTQTGAVDLLFFTGGVLNFDVDSDGTGDDQGGSSIRSNAATYTPYGDDAAMTLTATVDATSRILTVWILVRANQLTGAAVSMEAWLDDDNVIPVATQASVATTLDDVHEIKLRNDADTPTPLRVTLSGMDRVVNNFGFGFIGPAVVSASPSNVYDAWGLGLTA